MDSSTADAIQHHACNLTILLKEEHSFMFQSDYHLLMTLLYEVIDKSDDYIDKSDNFIDL